MQSGFDEYASMNVERAANPLDAAIAERDADILSMVRRSLDRKDVLLAFQPVVACRNPEHIAFFEGLIRVLDDTGRIIPAAEFINACENTETGRIIDCLALELGLETLARAPELRLAINMSARSIGYSRWTKTLHAGLDGRPTVAERLIIEITESSTIAMPDITKAFMEEMQLIGVSFALDDFGAGYTAFRHLRDFDFDIIKIAGEFIRGIHSDPDNRVLTQALVSISKQFDMFTVAEAVECEEDAKLLIEMGADCMQGYYFGVPTTRPSWPDFPREILRAG
ncbi:EAL domain-containing protein [Aliiruegeria lutimaris]|uniref:EAL domain, c-di-GMP-specific phosphodiesterase class I (Or its enzymatically inactive variant) n=1 Tax=Aliiruegeria lutimaris TaxID=571298 RepID=A0A1G8VYU8_9RHOB|nr:EAL domain-containing protein [Aliiruegeria lutimaris]SDJ70400.1 EAL domain, c-di-GMP-specific phosphodiesterase class I (or its enzymatically inactive variant) [Aliiruegeria lutimaris]